MTLTALPHRFLQKLVTSMSPAEQVTVTDPLGVIKEITLFNPNSSTTKVSLWVVPQEETLQDKHLVLNQIPVIGYETKIFSDMTMTLTTGDRIAMSTTSPVATTLSGARFFPVTTE